MPFYKVALPHIYLEFQDFYVSDYLFNINQDLPV